ncbi:MAG: hypothetical protein Q9168_004796 [Polycauliona sp. 1 TL-2023]
MKPQAKLSLLQDVCIFCSTRLQQAAVRRTPRTQYTLFHVNAAASRPATQAAAAQDTFVSDYTQTPKESTSVWGDGWGKASFSVELTPEEAALKKTIQQQQSQAPELENDRRARPKPRPTRGAAHLRYHASKEHEPKLLGEDSSFRVDLNWDCQKCQATNHRDRNHCQNCNRSKGHVDAAQWRCPSCGWHNPRKSSRCSKCNSFHVEDGQMARMAQEWKHVSRYKQRGNSAKTPDPKDSATPEDEKRTERGRKLEEERTQRVEQTKNGRFIAFRPKNVKADTEHSQSQESLRSPSRIERPPVAASVNFQRGKQKKVRESDQQPFSLRPSQASYGSNASFDQRRQVATPLAGNPPSPSYSANVQQAPLSRSGNPLPSSTTASFGAGWGSHYQADTTLSEAEKKQRPPSTYNEVVEPASAEIKNIAGDNRASNNARGTYSSESGTPGSPQASNNTKASSAADTTWFQSIDTSFKPARPERLRDAESRLGASRLSEASGTTRGDISWLEATSSRPSSRAVDRDRERKAERSERKPWKAEQAWKGPHPEQTPPAASSYYSAANEQYTPGGHGQITSSSKEQPDPLDSAPLSLSTQYSPSRVQTTQTPEPEIPIPRKGYPSSRDALSDANLAPSVQNLGLDPLPYHRSNSARRPRHIRHRDEELDLEFEEDREDSRQRRKEQRKKEKAAQKAVLPPTPIYLPEYISVGNLARVLRVRVEDFSKKMQSLGFEETNNDHVLGSEDAGLIASEFNFEPIVDIASDFQDLQARPPADDQSLLPSRPPIVTIMGHVDHGKTTLLDYLRKSSVAASEHGGITQHIGAFSVPMPGGRQITFLDTPGHAAFLSMRQRGANVTDIVILVVAADDSVKPQTIEAIKHAQAAKVPIIVAINKIDKEDQNIDRVKQDLARYGVEIEDYGGDTQVVCVSGKTGQGLDELEDAVIAQSDILDMRAEAGGQAEGWVLEATTKKGGRVATVLVKRGTIRRGDIIAAGSTWAKIRTLKNEAGVQVPDAGPGIPVEVDGWKDQPTAGDEVLQAESEQQAKSAVDFRLAKIEKEQMASDMSAVNEARRLEQEKRDREQRDAEEKSASSLPTADNTSTAPITADLQPATDANKDTTIILPLLLKADVSGSIEACLNAITALGTPTVHPQILRSAVGPISESDVALAASSGAQIVNFNQTTAPEMARLAEREGVKFVEENVIYRLTDLVKGALEALLPVKIEVKVLGEAEVAKSFEVGVGGRKKVWVAGCRVRNGIIGRNPKVRVLRGGEGGEVVFRGQLISLRNIKKDITEARKGMECGMSFENWSDFKDGDQVQSLEEKEVRQRL